jgi:hypothetical protein
MDNMQESKDYISKLSHHLFWDIDISNADMDKTIEGYSVNVPLSKKSREKLT